MTNPGKESKLMRLYILFILLYVCTNLRAQQTFKDRFDLGLSKVDDCDRNWVTAYRSVHFEHEEEKGNRFLNLKYIKGNRTGMSFILLRTLIFPENIESQKIDIGIEVRGSTSYPLSVKLISYDDSERELETNTIEAKLTPTWKKNVVSAANGKMAAIKVIISYQGDQDINQVVSLRNISIKRGKKDITRAIINYPIDTTHVVFDKTYLKTLNRSDSLFENPISGLENIKVIGLGEITHGSKDISEARNLFVKDLITQHNCKLVLLEVPFDLTLLMNLYVTDKLDTLGKSRLKKNMDLTFFGAADAELLEWIRNYNHSYSKPVKVLGIDVAAKMGKIGYPLMDFHFHSFGREIMRPYIPMFMKEGAEETLNKIRIDQVIDKVLDSKDLEFYKYFMSSYIDQKDRSGDFSYKPSMSNRDESMFMAVRFLDSLYCEAGEKIAVLAHSWHLKKTPLITALTSENMLGSYLDRFYKDAYFSINFTFGTGTFLQDKCKSFSITTDTIHRPPVYTLESYAFQSNADFFYFPSDKLNAPPNQMLGIPRFKLGSDYTDFGNIKKRYDAIVFLRNVSALSRQEYNTLRASATYSRDSEKQYMELIKEMENDHERL